MWRVCARFSSLLLCSLLNEIIEQTKGVALETLTFWFMLKFSCCVHVAHHSICQTMRAVSVFLDFYASIFLSSCLFVCWIRESPTNFCLAICGSVALDGWQCKIEGNDVLCNGPMHTFNGLFIRFDYLPEYNFDFVHFSLTRTTMQSNRMKSGLWSGSNIEKFVHKECDSSASTSMSMDMCAKLINVDVCKWCSAQRNHISQSVCEMNKDWMKSR